MEECLMSQMHAVKGSQRQDGRFINRVIVYVPKNFHAEKLFFNIDNVTKYRDDPFDGPDQPYKHQFVYAPAT
jgi:hypothetical protein